MSFQGLYTRCGFGLTLLKNSNFSGRQFEKPPCVNESRMKPGTRMKGEMRLRYREQEASRPFAPPLVKTEEPLSIVQVRKLEESGAHFAVDSMWAASVCTLSAPVCWPSFK